MPTNLQRYDEHGHIHFLTVSCYRRMPFFGNEAVRDVVVRCMCESRKTLGFQWFGYVIMPEHVHWLIFPNMRQDPNRLIPISKVLLSLKTSIARQVKSQLREQWRENRTLGMPSLDRWATMKAEKKPIWTTLGIDFNVRSFDKLKEKLRYCHANPVKRGLVDRPEDWRWSSYRFYETSERSFFEMDWDGSWPPS